MSDGEATIFASATGTEMTAIGIFRISGPKATELFDVILVGIRPEPRRFGLMQLVDPRDGQLIDEVGVLFFRAPHSYSGDDVIEVHHHGSPAIGRLLCHILSVRPGFRMAEAGEFTRRALRCGKLAPNAIDAVGRIIAAQTESQVKAAANGLIADHSAVMKAWSENLKSALVLVEAEIDFGNEDDVDDVELAALRVDLRRVAREMREVIDQSAHVQELSDGITIVLFGAPNVGKSSLLNALVNRDVAIVTSIAGTTRDPVVVNLEIKGHLIRLVDTAGLRDSADPIERIGVDKSKVWIANADIAILVSDCPTEFERSQVSNPICVLTKCDLQQDWPVGPWISTSAVHGKGLGELLQSIETRLPNLSRHPGMTMSGSQCALLRQIVGHLGNVSDGVDLRIDQIAEELRLALATLGRVSGVIDSETLLDDVFRHFCIGK